MTKPAIEHKFVFHANAVALAAHIRRRDDFFVNAVASSCLPATGGIGTAEANGKDFRGMISYASASTRVFGDYADRNKARQYTYGNHGDNLLPTVTSVEARISGLRIAIGDRVVEVERLEADMQSSSDHKSETRFHTLRTKFEGIKVDKVRLNVIKHDDIFQGCDTMEKLRRAYREDAAFRAAYAHCFFPAASSPARCWFGKPKPALPESQGIVSGTVVTGLSWDAPGGKKDDVIAGNRVTLKGLGSLYLGEILVEEDFRRVTLLRFQLGSPDGGEGAAVDIQSNGTGIPPKFSRD